MVDIHNELWMPVFIDMHNLIMHIDDLWVNMIKKLCISIGSYGYP